MYILKNNKLFLICKGGNKQPEPLKSEITNDNILRLFVIKQSF